MPIEQTPIHLLLADDDEDDCTFFNEALQELPVDASLNTVNDGNQLMNLLKLPSTTLPDILFLDLNMPLKTGYECLNEIKLNEKLKNLPVIIYSTSLNPIDVKQLYDQGAYCYIRKPTEFSKLKRVINEALNNFRKNNPIRLPIEKFVLQIN